MLCLSKLRYDFTLKRILKKVVDEFLLNSVILHIVKITIFKDLSFKVNKITYGGQKLTSNSSNFTFSAPANYFCMLIACLSYRACRLLRIFIPACIPTRRCFSDNTPLPLENEADYFNLYISVILVLRRQLRVVGKAWCVGSHARAEEH